MPKLIDLTNQQFGRWTVLERDLKHYPDKKVRWICQCSCGNIKTVTGETLRRGQSKSCGCLQKEIAAKLATNRTPTNFINLLNQQFGDLLVINQTDERTKNGNIIWECQCSCGNKIKVNSALLRSNKKTHCGCKQISSKGEEKIKQILQENNIEYIYQYTNHTCKYPDSNTVARFDFFINNSYIIEYDGDLHFQESIGYGWNTEEKYKYTKNHDNYKNEWCKKNNIPLIRIPYTHYFQISLQDLLIETSKFIVIKNT